MKKIFLLFTIMTLCISVALAVEIKVKDSIINSSSTLKEYDFNKMNAFQVKNETKTALLANTPIEVRSVNPIMAENLNVGDKVGFTVLNTVRSANGEALIKEGTPVYGEVLAVKKKSKIGRPGMITIGDFYTNAVDGTVVTSKTNITETGKSNVLKSIALSAIVFPLFVLMEGNDAIIQDGVIKTINTNDTAYILGENL